MSGQEPDLVSAQEHKVPQQQRDRQEQALRKSGWESLFNPAQREKLDGGPHSSLAGLSGGAM
eukprot:4473562-Pyramimonas_sp.AAC.1